MAAFEIGIVLPNMQFGPDRTTAHRPEIRALARRAEAIGFDTIWVADELLWRMEDGPPRGCWDGISLAGAVAEATSRAKVGTWVLSALHRNPAIIRSVGVSVRPLEPAGFRSDVISGSAEEIADGFRTFRDAGFTQLEITFGPGTMEALEALAPVVEAVHAD